MGRTNNSCEQIRMESPLVYECCETDCFSKRCFSKLMLPFLKTGIGKMIVNGYIEKEAANKDTSMGNREYGKREDEMEKTMLAVWREVRECKEVQSMSYVSVHDRKRTDICP